MGYLIPEEPSSRGNERGGATQTASDLARDGEHQPHHLWPPSAVGSNISGQPPSITVMPRCRVLGGASETLPLPYRRCIHTA